MVPDYLSSHFVFRSDTLSYNLSESDCCLPSHSPAPIIVKEACPTAELYCGIVYPWISGTHPLLMNLNLSYNFGSSLM